MTTLKQPKPREARCPDCGKLLGKMTLETIGAVILEAWCKRCEKFVSIPVVRATA